jgi:[acyl-carrier-protein] S-malonyltransferase
VLAIVSPGQGSQSAQMLSNWLEDSTSENLLNDFSKFVGLDLIELGTKATSEEIKQTEISQPLIVATSLLALHLLDISKLDPPADSVLVGGHSVGEFAAAKIAQAIDNQTALELVSARGKAMAISAKESADTGMSAVLGGEKAQIINQIEEFGLVAANVNADGQIVAAGEISLLEKFAQNPPAGTRVRPLDVSAAFHTKFMTSAKNNLSSLFESKNFNDLKYKMVSNKDGEIVKNSTDLKDRLLSQIDSPVRWDLCQETFKKFGITGLLELAPGGVLAGIAKRELPSVELFSIKSLEDIAAAKEFVTTHAGAN